MNLFILDASPDKAALYHGDRDLTSGIVQACQMMSFAHLLRDGPGTAQAKPPMIASLPPRDENRSSVRWVAANSENYQWTLALVHELLRQYRLRYRKTNVYEPAYLALGVLPRNLPRGLRTAFAQDMPTKYRRADAVDAYRVYYAAERFRRASWSMPAIVPHWWAPVCEVAVMLTEARV